MATVDIVLTNTIQKALIDDVDKDLVNVNWYYSKVNGGKRTIRTCKLGTTVNLGRTILQRVIGRPLAPFEYTGYLNGNPYDCRRSNLFVADIHQVNHRRRIFDNNEIGIKGVTKMKRNGKYRARIYVNGKAIYLGEHDYLEHAAAAYRKAAEMYYGEYAYLD